MVYLDWVVSLSASGLALGTLQRLSAGAERILLTPLPPIFGPVMVHLVVAGTPDAL